MKRASLAALTLAGIWATLLQPGCVSKKDFDQLQRSCDADRAELRAQLASAQTELSGLKQEKALSASAAEKLRSDLLDKISENAKLVAAINGLRAELDKRQPVVNIEGPVLSPEVHAALKKFATDHPGLIEYDEKAGLVRFKSDLLFDSGSYELKGGELDKQLKDFAEVINIPAAQAYDVLVVGHTDAQPVSRPTTKAKTPTNWHLSVFRAVSVVEALMRNGVGPKRLGAMGFGDLRPRVPSGPNGNTPENRRVEIYLVPKGALATVPGVVPAVPRGEAAPVPGPAAPAPAPAPAPGPGDASK